MTVALQPQRITANVIFYSVLALVAAGCVFYWTQAQHPVKDIMLGGVLAMLFFIALIKARSLQPLGGALGVFGLIFASSICIIGLNVMHDETPLSGKAIAEMSLSGCAKEEVASTIKTFGPVTRNDIKRVVTKRCEQIFTPYQRPTYQNEQFVDEQKLKALADAQLEAL